MRALIDTCVMIDGLNDRPQFAAPAQQILLAIERGAITGCVTGKSFSDIYYISRREMHDLGRTNSAMDWILRHMTILDTTGDDCRAGFARQWRDFEDALMAATALRTDMDCIITRNIKDFKDSPIAIYTPEQFVRRLQNFPLPSSI